MFIGNRVHRRVFKGYGWCNTIFDNALQKTYIGDHTLYIPVMHMTQSKNTSIRLGEILDNLINQYAAFMGMKRSSVIRQVLMEGLFQKTKAAQFQHFEEWIGQREAFTLLTKCEKCGSEKCLGFFHIDGNIDNISTNNIVTLCVPCINAFQSWKLNQNGIEKFIEWFFA